MPCDSDTIAAISTALGEGGLGVVRLSGPAAIVIADQIFQSKNKQTVREQKNFTVRIGHIVSQKELPAGNWVDEVLLLVMREVRHVQVF